MLITKGELAGAAPYVSELAASARPGEKSTFLQWIDLLLQNRLVGEAVQTWRALGEKGDPFPAKPANLPGVTIHPLEAGGWQILLNGNQPERCVLLEAVQPVQAGDAYLLQEILEDKLSPAGGLSWQLETLEAAPRILETSFTVPPGVEAVKVRLVYQRPSGSLRAEGEIRVPSLGLRKIR